MLKEKYKVIDLFLQVVKGLKNYNFKLQYTYYRGLNKICIGLICDLGKPQKKNSFLMAGPLTPYSSPPPRA